VRRGGGRLGVLVLGIGERGGGVVLGLQCRQTGSFILLCLQVRFRAGDGRLPTNGASADGVSCFGTL